MGVRGFQMTGALWKPKTQSRVSITVKNSPYSPNTIVQIMEWMYGMYLSVVAWNSVKPMHSVYKNLVIFLGVGALFWSPEMDLWSMRHLNSFLVQGGGHLNKTFPKLQMPGGGGCPGGGREMLKLHFDWYINYLQGVSFPLETQQLN